MPKYRHVHTGATRIAKSWPGHGWLIVREEEPAPAPVPAPVQAFPKAKRGRKRKAAAAVEAPVIAAEAPTDELDPVAYDAEEAVEAEEAGS